MNFAQIKRLTSIVAAPLLVLGYYLADDNYKRYQDKLIHCGTEPANLAETSQFGITLMAPLLLFVAVLLLFRAGIHLKQKWRRRATPDV